MLAEPRKSPFCIADGLCLIEVKRQHLSCIIPGYLVGISNKGSWYKNRGFAWYVEDLNEMFDVYCIYNAIFKSMITYLTIPILKNLCSQYILAFAYIQNSFIRESISIIHYSWFYAPKIIFECTNKATSLNQQHYIRCTFLSSNIGISIKAMSQ